MSAHAYVYDLLFRMIDNDEWHRGGVSHRLNKYTTKD